MQLTVYKKYKNNSLRTIRLFVSEWDGRRDWPQITAEHEVVWSIWSEQKLDIVTVKFELILRDKKGEKLYTEVGLVL